MTEKCENCPILVQCNNVYRRVASQNAVLVKRSWLYSSHETDEYVQSVQERVDLGLDVEQADLIRLDRLRRMGQRVSDFNERWAAIDQIASAMVKALSHAALCSGPQYGTISRWAIDKLERQDDQSGANYFKVAYAKCASREVYDAHQELRRASSDIPGIG